MTGAKCCICYKVFNACIFKIKSVIIGEEQRLRVFVNRVLKRIFGYKRKWQEAAENS
jgi:hypothetical protein